MKHIAQREATLQAEAQSTRREECRFDKALGLPMYQTDDRALAWKAVPDGDAGSHASTAASSSEPMPSSGVESFRALAAGEITVGDARAKAFDVCSHLVQNTELITNIFDQKLLIGQCSDNREGSYLALCKLAEYKNRHHSFVSLPGIFTGRYSSTQLKTQFDLSDCPFRITIYRQSSEVRRVSERIAHTCQPHKASDRQGLT